MASTLTKILVHVVFSTKHRENLIDESIEPQLFAYIGGVCRRMKSPLLAMNGTPNHVHMLVSLAKTTTLSDLLLDVKRDSSKWIKEQDPRFSDFAWQTGYFGFSVGDSTLERTKRYITAQKSHHQKVDFKDEVRAFLRRHRLEWNEEYIWD